jgi:hypothetical protein
VAPRTSAYRPNECRRRRLCQVRQPDYPRAVRKARRYRPNQTERPTASFTFQPGLIIGHTLGNRSYAGHAGQASPAPAAVCSSMGITKGILLLLRSLLDQFVYLVGSFFDGFQLRISFISTHKDRRLPKHFIFLGKSGVLHDLLQRRR